MMKSLHAANRLLSRQSVGPDASHQLTKNSLSVDKGHVLALLQHIAPITLTPESFFYVDTKLGFWLALQEVVGSGLGLFGCFRFLY